MKLWSGPKLDNGLWLPDKPGWNCRFYYARPHVIKEVIDRLFQCQDNVWELIDYKTGYPSQQTSSARLAYYQAQVGLYALCRHKLLPAQATIPTTIFFAGTSETKQRTFTVVELNQLELDWIQRLEEIDQPYPPKNLDHCHGLPLPD